MLARKMKLMVDRFCADPRQPVRRRPGSIYWFGITFPSSSSLHIFSFRYVPGPHSHYKRFILWVVYWC